MLRKIILIFCVTLLSASYSFSIDSPFNFLRYQSNARNAALAGSGIALTNEISSLYINPALISTVEDKQLQATFLKHILDINSGSVVYVHNNDYGTFAASAGFTSYGSFDYADKVGNRNGNSFSASDLSFGLSYSNKLDTNFYYGATLKYIYAGIEEVSASAIAVDAGLIYLMSDNRTKIGLSILNAGAQISKISNESESLPLDVRVGFNHRLRGLPLLFNFSFHHLADETDSFFSKFKSFSVGGEFNLGKIIMVRVGYDNQIRSSTDAEVDKGLTGFSGGVGILLEDINIDYGFSRYGSAANLHRFSISVNVNKLL